MISSNSSFTGSGRNPITPYHTFSSFISNSNPACSENPTQDKSFFNVNCSYSSGSHTFIDCSWDNKDSGTNGYGIYYVLPSSDSASSLTVTHCSFIHCHASGGVGGGGVFAQCVGSASVCDSNFYDCSCGSYDYMEGGGVLLNYIAVKPQIVHCTLFLCSSPDDGGGCGIWCSNSSLPYAVDSCRFIHCKGTHQTSSQGGGIVIGWNTDFITCTNSLFCACSAPTEGGGVWINHPPQTDLHPITFCFFCENIAGQGKDVLLRNFQMTPQPITYSFSCESENGKVSGGSDYWLPQTNTIIKVFVSLSSTADKISIHTNMDDDTDVYFLSLLDN